MPAIAFLLSLVGLVPFVYFALEAVGPDTSTAPVMMVSLIDYAALILAFAGGVHWGLALAPNSARPSLRLFAGVLPMILAWVGLVVAQMMRAPTVALALLAVGYLATVLTEHRAARRLLVPSNYVWLRWGFSFVAVVMMVMVLVLRGVGQTIVF